MKPGDLVRSTFGDGEVVEVRDGGSWPIRVRFGGARRDGWFAPGELVRLSVLGGPPLDDKTIAKRGGK